jgi:thiosulfate dehydrogenase
MKYLFASAASIRLAAAVVIVGASCMPVRPQSASLWTVPEIGALPRDAHGLQVREGRDLITAT